MTMPRDMSTATDIENRITGPGYYPRRPTMPGDWYTIPNDMRWIYRVELFDALGNVITGLLWRGRGTYVCIDPPDDLRTERVTAWSISGDYRRHTVHCPPTPVVGFTLRLRHDSPSRNPDAPYRFKFTPEFK